MSYKQTSPVPVIEGGTEKQSFTAFAVIITGTTDTGAFQSIASLGTSGHVLTSNGADALPSFKAAPIYDSDVVFNAVSSDPGSPTDGQVWFNTTSNSFKGEANSVTITFSYT